jgi:hypothetical protein
LVSEYFFELLYTAPSAVRSSRSSAEKDIPMPLFFEAILMSMGMLALFFLAFLLLFLLAVSLAPIERELSKYIWTATAPPPPKLPAPGGSFRDFSKKH